MMAPKYERVRLLKVALEHLSEIAGQLDDPIDSIEIHRDEVRFSAGESFVPVMITSQGSGKKSSGAVVVGGGRYGASIGQKRHK